MSRLLLIPARLPPCPTRPRSSSRTSNPQLHGLRPEDPALAERASKAEEVAGGRVHAGERAGILDPGLWRGRLGLEADALFREQPLVRDRAPLPHAVQLVEVRL